MATAIHISGFTADPENIRPLLDDLAAELSQLGISLDMESTRDTNTQIGIALGAMNRENGLSVGSLGSTPTRPTLIVPLLAPSNLINGLAAPDEDTIPTTIALKLNSFTHHSNNSVKQQHLNLRCTTLTQMEEAYATMNQRRISGTTTGPNWTHIFNVAILTQALEDAHGIITADLIHLLSQDLDTDGQHWISDNLVGVPMEHTYMKDDQTESPRFRSLFNSGLAIYVYSDPSTAHSYEAIQNMNTALLGDRTTTHRMTKLNGMPIYIEKPEDPSNPKRISADRIPQRISKPDLAIASFRDLPPWIQAPHLILILHAIMGIPYDAICNVVPATVQMRDIPKPPTHLRYLPDAMVLLDSMETLATVMRSAPAILQAIGHLNEGHDSRTEIYSPNSNSKGGLKQLRPSPGTILTPSMLHTKGTICEAVRNSNALDYQPPAPSPPTTPPQHASSRPTDHTTNSASSSRSNSPRKKRVLGDDKTSSAQDDMTKESLLAEIKSDPLNALQMIRWACEQEATEQPNSDFAKNLSIWTDHWSMREVQGRAEAPSPHQSLDFHKADMQSATHVGPPDTSDSQS
jgi:hypothetical protein